MPLSLVATCALGLEEFLEGELSALGVREPVRAKGAVTFRGDWPMVWRANLRLRTANRVLLELASWPATNALELVRGAEAVVGGKGPLPGLFSPERSLAVRATTTASRFTDARFVALKVKDGLVDGQRARFGSRSSIDRDHPDLPLRVWLAGDRATLLLDTSGEPLDRRGYRVASGDAPVREQLAAACVLASGWDGRGPVVDPMCGTGTLLAEAGWIALGRAPGSLRERWIFEGFPGFRREAFERVREEPAAPLAPAVRLIGRDRARAAVRAAVLNLDRAGLGAHAEIELGDAFELTPPPGPGLVLINPPYGERVASSSEAWRRLGDLLKQRFAGYRAVVLAGDRDRGKHLGLRPKRRIPVWNGPLEARILIFDLY